MLYLLVDRFLNIGEYYAVISGILLIVTIMVNPDGIAGKLPPRIPWPAARKIAVSTGNEERRTEPATARTPLSPPTGDVLLSVQGGVSVKYGAVQAASDVTFDVRRGEIVGLIGPNGAGKTTVIDAITGFAAATGTVVLDGADVSSLRPYRLSRSGLGRSFQDVELYDDLSVAENVTVGAARGDESSTPAVAERVRAVLETVGLGDVADAEVSTVAGQTPAGVGGRVLVASPKVALLDEPAAGLDSAESRWLGERLRAARDAGTSILLVDHDMELVLTICDRVVVLDLGRVVACGTPEEVRADERVISAYLGLPVDQADLEHDAIPPELAAAPKHDAQEALS